MPTSTVPYEVLFELVNDTHSAATVQLVHNAQDDSEGGGGATILLQQRENVSLVLSAGATYQYILRQRRKEVTMS
ncbi:hypothetical protein PLICRDRAFT_100618 [Plicaturopsis crispa FD-325 SS-3]|nr:hypothetical protein PLICRDRAFT_100618 [Plicaturopsis crispa FD-325 SS-3]